MTATPPTNAYTEDLTVQRLGANHVGARFVFRSRWTPESRHRCQNHEDWNVEFKSRDERIKDGKLCHFDAMFPRAMGVLLDRFKVRILLNVLYFQAGLWHIINTVADSVQCRKINTSDFLGSQIQNSAAH